MQLGQQIERLRQGPRWQAWKRKGGETGIEAGIEIGIEIGIEVGIEIGIEQVETQ